MVKAGDQIVDLSARELGVLEMLMLRAGRLVSKEHLANHLCGWGEEVGANAIEVYVHRLRKKLEPFGIRIATLRGLGYVWRNPPRMPESRFSLAALRLQFAAGGSAAAISRYCCFSGPCRW